MIRALYSAAGGMQAQQMSMDVVASNLANVGTTGYKRARAEFADLVYDQMLATAPAQPAPLQVGNGVRLAGVQRILANGQLQSTQRNLDVALQGAGFLRVQGRDGAELYTRSGSLHLDGEGRLTTATGQLVLGEAGIISVPAEAGQLEIATDGTIRRQNAATGLPETLARLSLATFSNPEGLAAMGDNLLASTAASGAPQLAAPGAAGAATLAQGFLETANVEMVTEMMNLITAQRVYEINSRTLQSADEMWGMANRLKR